MNECSRLSINVLSPHVNHSTSRFSVLGENIVFPLLAIKNIGRALIEKIVAERKENGNFKSFWDFCKRVSGTELNRRALECLIKSGALDGLDLNRCEMLRNIDLAVESAAKENSMYAGGQLDLFSTFSDEEFTSEPAFVRANEMPKNDLLNFEKEVSGLYFSGHPLEEFRTVAESFNCPRTTDLYESLETGNESAIDNKKVTFLGIINSVKKKVTKRDDIMAFCGVEDLYGDIEMIVFPKTLAMYNTLLNVGSIVLVEGKISVKDDEIKLLAEKISLAPEKVDDAVLSVRKDINSNKESKRKGLFLRVNSGKTTCIDKIKNLISIFEGDTPVYLFFTETGKYEFIGKDYLTKVNEPMINELKYILGDENVVLRE
jgi:DNA polymerase-3 subunit alpha